METQILATKKSASKGAVWTGRIISTLCVLFLLFDAVIKLIREQHAVDGTAQLGWPVSSLVPMGVVLLVSTLLYAIPRTAFLGAVLITAYLGGAVATIARIGLPFYFPVVFGVLVWLGLYLRDEKLRSHFSR